MDREELITVKNAIEKLSKSLETLKNSMVASHGSWRGTIEAAFYEAQGGVIRTSNNLGKGSNHLDSLMKAHKSLTNHINSINSNIGNTAVNKDLLRELNKGLKPGLKYFRKNQQILNDAIELAKKLNQDHGKRLISFPFDGGKRVPNNLPSKKLQELFNKNLLPRNYRIKGSVELLRNQIKNLPMNSSEALKNWRSTVGAGTGVILRLTRVLFWRSLWLEAGILGKDILKALKDISKLLRMPMIIILPREDFLFHQNKAPLTAFRIQKHYKIKKGKGIIFNNTVENFQGNWTKRIIV